MGSAAALNLLSTRTVLQLQGGNTNAGLWQRVKKRAVRFCVPEMRSVEDGWQALDDKVNTYPMKRGFTAIGTGGDEFMDAMVAAVEMVLQCSVPQELVTKKLSSRGKYVSVRIGPVLVQSREQWATIKQHKVLLEESSNSSGSSFENLDGKLEYFWRDENDSSQYANLMTPDASPTKRNKPKQIYVTRGNYFGPHPIETEECTKASSSSSWRSAGSTSGDLKQPPRNELLLGEALCHSQTRAREAEKLASQAYEEKDQLMHLLIKEASLSFAYRQCVLALQAQNLCLMRMCKETWNSSSRLLRSQFNKKRNNNRKVKPCCSDALLRWTLAFAFGLGLAGAGLMLGWGMGWIVFAL